MLYQYNNYNSNYDYDTDVIDLSWVHEARDEPESARYLCRWCGPHDSVMFRVTDSKLLEFAGGNIR
jgi:hypothetical protein